MVTIYFTVHDQKAHTYQSRSYTQKMLSLKAATGLPQIKLSTCYSEMAARAAQLVEQFCDTRDLLNIAQIEVEPFTSLSILFK